MLSDHKMKYLLITVSILILLGLISLPFFMYRSVNQQNEYIHYKAATDYVANKYGEGYHLTSSEPHYEPAQLFVPKLAYYEYYFENDQAFSVHLTVSNENDVTDLTPPELTADYYRYLEEYINCHLDPDADYLIYVDLSGHDAGIYNSFFDLLASDEKTDIDLTINLMIIDVENKSKYKWVYNLFEQMNQIQYHSFRFSLAFPDYLNQYPDDKITSHSNKFPGIHADYTHPYVYEVSDGKISNDNLRTFFYSE